MKLCYYYQRVMRKKLPFACSELKLYCPIKRKDKYMCPGDYVENITRIANNKKSNKG